jgi:hypothetical protein
MSANCYRAFGLTLVGGLLLWEPAALGQVQPTWVDPPDNLSRPNVHEGAGVASRNGTGATQQLPRAEIDSSPGDQGDPAVTSSTSPAEFNRGAMASGSPDRLGRTAAAQSDLTKTAQAAVDLASAYLHEWSSPNRVTLASTSSFYGPTVLFHGRERSYQSVFAEKQRFAKRWPERTYQYRPELTQVACEADGASCTVWSLFDFSAVDRDHRRRSRGLGEHELVISFVGNRPVIVAETSRVLRRGAVPRH